MYVKVFSLVKDEMFILANDIYNLEKKKNNLLQFSFLLIHSLPGSCLNTKLKKQTTTTSTATTPFH